MIGVQKEYWHFLTVFGILGGIGTSLIFTPAVASIGHFFLVRRGTATGIAAVGGSIGGIIFPLTLQSLLPRLGWGWSTRIMAFISLILLLMANLLIRSRLPRSTTKKATTSGGGARPDFRIFRDVTFSLTTAAVFLTEMGLFVPLSFLPSYAIAQGFEEDFAYQLLAIFNAGSVFGRWLPGYVADEVGRFNTMIITIGMCLISTLSLWLPAGKSLAVIIVYAVIFGFASGSNISLTPVCVGQLCETERYGTFYATCYTVVSFGYVVLIPSFVVVRRSTLLRYLLFDSTVVPAPPLFITPKPSSCWIITLRN